MFPQSYRSRQSSHGLHEWRLVLNPFSCLVFVNFGSIKVLALFVPTVSNFIVFSRPSSRKVFHLLPAWKSFFHFTLSSLYTPFDVQRSRFLTFPLITSPQWSSTTTRSLLWAGWRCSPTWPDSAWVTTMCAITPSCHAAALISCRRLNHALSSRQTASTASFWITTEFAICKRFDWICFLNSNCWCWMITKYPLWLVRT